MSLELEEADFFCEDIFFSRTDNRGKIVSGNVIFQRVSQYGWDELIQKPHSIIRHPDMPRGVFYLMWDWLRKGDVFGGYVKNRAKDGRYYWVYAIVTPVEDGYLSVRIKPCSPVLDAIKTAYATLHTAERDGKLPPAESHMLVLDKIGSLGFRDYASFMASALITEIEHRDALLDRQADKVAACFGTVMQQANALILRAETISQAYHAHQFVPLNLLVQAGRIGREGAAIGAISHSYNLLSADMKEGLAAFAAAARRVADVTCQGAFLMGTTRLQQEVVEQLRQEPGQNGIDQAHEMSRLTMQEMFYREKAARKLRLIRDEVAVFHKKTVEMRRMSSGLAAIRVMGKVEAGRLERDVLGSLVTDLEAFQKTIAAGLEDIEAINDLLRKNIVSLHDRCAAIG